jgi:hypothetical protein
VVFPGSGISFWTVWFFGYRTGWFFIDIGSFATNQLLVQTYRDTAACTIAHLPVFSSMVFTAMLVKRRMKQLEINPGQLGRTTNVGHVKLRNQIRNLTLSAKQNIGPHESIHSYVTSGNACNYYIKKGHCGSP